MAWLLIDNSNTRTKLALGDANGLLDWRAVIPTAELEAALLDRKLAGLAFTGVAVASVVPVKADVIASYFSARRQPVHFLSHESPLGFGFDLDHPGQIGNDRLANAVALRERCGFPGIAIDFGTAVTFSVLSPEGNFMGGAIAAGMGAMTAYLANRTAQLPAIEPREPASAIGRTTEAALQSGVVHGHRGMVRGILREIISELGGEPQVIATGGGAAFASKGIYEINHIDPDLTLSGIRIVASRVI